MPLFKTIPVGLKDYIRVENNNFFKEIFQYLYSQQEEVLYNHSPIYPFAYLNLGRMKLYINKDVTFGIEDDIIPVVRKHELTLEHAPSFTIHCPLASNDKILQVVEHFDKHSSSPVEIIDVTKDYAEKFIVANPSWIKVKTSDDVLQDAAKLTSLAGRNFSSLRNTLKHVKNDLNPITQQLSTDNYKDALSVFEQWKEDSKDRYFRITIGRDLRLFQEYHNKLDFTNFFGYVHYVDNNPAAASFGTRSYKDPTYGQDITVKALYKYKGMGDYAFIHLVQEMNKQGINLVNDSGGQGKVALNKQKFQPVGSIQMYDLKRK